MNFLHLPEDVLMEIFNYLSIEELSRLESVCDSLQFLIERKLNGKRTFVTTSKYFGPFNVYKIPFQNEPFCINCCQWNINNLIELNCVNDLKYFVEKFENVINLIISFDIDFYYPTENLFDQHNEKKFEFEIKSFFDHKSLEKLECLCIEIDLNKFNNVNWSNILSNVYPKLKHLTVIGSGCDNFSQKILLLPSMPQLQDLYIDGNIWFENGFQDLKNMNLKRFGYKSDSLYSLIKGFKLVHSNDKSTNIKSFTQMIKYTENYTKFSQHDICRHAFLFSDINAFKETFKYYNLSTLNIDLDNANQMNIYSSLEQFHNLVSLNVIDYEIFDSNPNIDFNTGLNLFLNATPNLTSLSLPYYISSSEIEHLSLRFKQLEKLEINDTSLKKELDIDDLKKFWKVIAHMKSLKQLVLNIECEKKRKVRKKKCLRKFFGFEELANSKSITKILFTNESFCHKPTFDKIVESCKALANNLQNKYLHLYLFIYGSEFQQLNFDSFRDEHKLPKNMKLLYDKWHFIL